MNPKNLMLVSMERSGNSWMGAVISEIHQGIYGGEIPKWYHEISRVYAVDPKYPMPEGWCSVYDVDPQELLDRGYDKIIVLERNLETVERAFFMYHDMPYSEGLERYPEYFESIRKYWNIVHKERIDDPRIHYVHLDDLNNHTFDAFNKIFDFLGYPKKVKAHDTMSWCRNYNEKDSMCEYQECGHCLTFEPKVQRGLVVPVNPPDRNWQCFSDFLPIGHPVSDTLKMIQLRYASNQTEAQIQLQAIKEGKDDRNMKMNEDNIYPYIFYNEDYTVIENPYKMAPEERDYQGNCSFRVVVDALVDVLEVMKEEECAMCLCEVDDKYTLEVWREATIIKHIVVCKECKEKYGYRVKFLDGELMEYPGDIK